MYDNSSAVIEPATHGRGAHQALLLKRKNPQNSTDLRILNGDNITCFGGKTNVREDFDLGRKAAGLSVAFLDIQLKNLEHLIDHQINYVV